MNNRDVDIDIRNPHVDEDIEIYIFTLINNFPDAVDVLDIIFDFQDVENTYINMIKSLYYEAFKEEDLYYTEIDFQKAVLNDNLNVSKLKWAFYRILNWRRWFHEPIGNNIYNEKKLLTKLKEELKMMY